MRYQVTNIQVDHVLYQSNDLKQAEDMRDRWKEQLPDYEKVIMLIDSFTGEILD
jgi:hypothetical protein